MPERTCAVCSEELPAGSTARRRYCSRRCTNWATRHLNAVTCSRAGCDRPNRARQLCSQHYNETFAAERHALTSVPCEACGASVMRHGSNNKSRRVSCSPRCRAFLQHGRFPKSRELVGPLPWTDPKPRSTDAPMTVVPSGGGAWTSGPCSWCGEQFTAWSPSTAARYCGRRCSRTAAKSISGRFVVPPPVRSSIYERDGWVCQLCFEPVDRDCPPTADWAPSLDHIVPQSRQLVPDHSPEALRLAHRWCNAVRGDDTYYTAADLAAPALSA